MTRLTILMYHMISEPRSEKERRYACPRARFANHMRFLRKRAFNVVSLDAVGRCLHGKETLPEQSVAITFDDGFRNNYENALPTLREFDFPATSFIVSGLVGKTNSWMTAKGYPERHLMGRREIEEMKKNGITIASHTINHCRLSALGCEGAKNEIESSKKSLEDMLGTAINHFAYPYGDMNESIVSMVKDAGYYTACSTRSGFNSEHVSPFVLRRLEIYGTDTLWNFMWKLKFGTNEATLALPLKYYYSRILDRLAPFTPKQ